MNWPRNNEAVTKMFDQSGTGVLDSGLIYVRYKCKAAAMVAGRLVAQCVQYGCDKFTGVTFESALIQDR